MNEIFDKLILRMFFTLFICLILVLYKHAHSFLYPSSRLQLFKRFYPSKNSVDTIHLFARLIGIGLIFSEFYFYISKGIAIAIVDFTIKSCMAFGLFLTSIYIMESVVLYNFEYSDEVLKRKNYSYSIISFSQVIALAYILKTVLKVTNESLIFTLLLWLFAMVITGFMAKKFHLLSKLPLNKLVIQKNLAAAFSYTGFIWGWGLIMASSLNQPVSNITTFAAQIGLKIMLSILIFPLFKFGLTYIFKLQDDLKEEDITSAEGPALGYGIYEGAIMFTSAFLTTVITGQIHFGTFYPVF